MRWVNEIYPLLPFSLSYGPPIILSLVHLSFHLSVSLSLRCAF